MNTPTPTGRGAGLLVRLETDRSLTALCLGHPRGAVLVAGTELGEVLLFAAATGALAQRLVDPAASKSAVTSLAWAELEGAEHVIVGHRNGSVRVFHLERGAVVASMAAHRSDVSALAYLEPARLLATGGTDGGIKLWQLGGDAAVAATVGAAARGQAPRAAAPQLREPLQHLKGHAGELTRLVFTPDGSSLVSGDSRGGLRVWDVQCGAAGALLHALGGHSGGITGLVCHPEERLFVSCSADKTLRVWDVDLPTPRCIGVHGPEGRREVRGVAFAPGGRALMAAYPDGLRVFTLDPLTLQDTADLQWSRVHSIHYADGKVLGISLWRGDAGLHCVDLRRMRPFLGSAGAGAGAARALSLGQAPAGSGAGTSLDGGASSAAPPAQGLRFSEKHQVAGSSAPTTSAPAEAPAPVAAAGPPPGPGPAARFVAQQRRQVLEARGAAANAGPAFEVRCPVRPASVSTTPAGSRAPPPGAHAGQPALEARGAGGRPPRASAEENSGAELQRRFSAGDKAENPAAKEPPTAGAEPAHAPPAPQPLSMLAVASHRGFQLAAQQGHREQCRRLQASRGLLGDVQRALQRGDAQAAVRLLKESKDLAVAAKVIESRALQQRNPDQFTLELCTAAAPLMRALLASPAVTHRQAALLLLDATLARWGEYMQGVLRPTPRLRQVDLALEKRVQRSRALRAALLELAPALEQLGARLGGGRDQQLLERLREL